MVLKRSYKLTEKLHRLVCRRKKSNKLLTALSLRVSIWLSIRFVTLRKHHLNSDMNVVGYVNEEFFCSGKESSMLSFKKKERSGRQKAAGHTLHVAAPVQGELIDLSNVADQVFSQKMMGEGFAVVPSSEHVVAPVSGKAVTVFPTGHAIGIRTAQGIDVLVHVGLDTVNLKGEGFKVLIHEGDEVQIGQPIVDFDQQVLRRHGLDATTMVIFTEGFRQKIKVNPKKVKAGDVLIGA